MSFIITILAALLVFSAVIAIHEFGHFTVAKLCGIQVNEFSIGMGPVLWKKNHKGTQYSLRALPVGGFVALEGEESPESQQAEAAHTVQEQPAPETEASVQPTGVPLNEAPVWQRALVMVAGAVMNFVLGFVVLVILIAAQNEPITSKTIYAIQDGALCGQTGLQAGDKVLAVNGRRCFVANDILYELVRTRSYSADFTVLRDGQKVQLPGVQFDTWQDEQGETHMSIGFSVYGLEKDPWQRAAGGGQQRAVLRAHRVHLPCGLSARAGEHQQPLRPGGHRVGHRAGRQLWLAGLAGAAGTDYRQPWHPQPTAFPCAGRRQGGIFDH